MPLFPWEIRKYIQRRRRQNKSTLIILVALFSCCATVIETSSKRYPSFGTGKHFLMNSPLFSSTVAMKVAQKLAYGN